MKAVRNMNAEGKSSDRKEFPASTAISGTSFQTPKTARVRTGFAVFRRGL